MAHFAWSRQVYEASISSRCWWYTAYSAGWDKSHEYGHDLRTDDELQEIVRMEGETAPIPNWAQEIVTRAINFVPPCGHYRFPLPYLDLIAAIGDETPPRFLCGCYTAEAGRKRRMTDYLLLLDAWLAGAGPGDAARELRLRQHDGLDWQSICDTCWEVLGERNEGKELLIERVLHRQRWWLKSLTWCDDHRDVFGRDAYLGDVRVTHESYGNPPSGDPFFTELQVPRVTRLEARLAEVCPEWPTMKTRIECSWLCAPKAFRYLERLLWDIGMGRPSALTDAVPDFLHVEDTYLAVQEDAPAWWDACQRALHGWWRGETLHGAVAVEICRRLKTPTPVKYWLVRLLARRLALQEACAEIGKLVRQPTTE